MTGLIAALLFVQVGISLMRLGFDFHYLQTEDDDDDC